MVRTMNSMNVSLLLYFIFSKMICLFTRNNVANFPTASRTISKVMNGGFGGIILAVKANLSPEKRLFQREQIASPSVMKVIKCNQIVTRWLADSLGKHYYTGGSVSLSVVDMWDTQQ